jgi:hypothetical protein
MSDARPPDAPAPETAEDARHRWILLAVSCAMVAVPFTLVTFPPSTDMGQHVAQIRLFLDALGSAESAYEIQWLTPYNLSYAIVGAMYAIVGPERAARFSLLAVALLWAAAAHALAWKFDRPATSATLASVFVFNQSLYWGFFNFLAGWPLFAAWLVAVSAPRRRPEGWTDAVLLAILAFLLFFTHALWFGAAMAWLGVATLVQRPGLATLVRRALAVLPAGLVAAFWYLQFATTWYAGKQSTWKASPLEKLTSPWFAEHMLGGVWGSLEYTTLGAVALWIAVGLVQHRASLGGAVAPVLAICAALFLVVALFGPYRLQNTIVFDERWLPGAAVLLLLAAPAPLIAARLRNVLAVAVLAGFVTATAGEWYAFERDELSGFDEAIAALPESPRVLGLDFVRSSSIVRGSPFLQMFAYSQAIRGGRLNFSFAEFPQSFVVSRSRNAPALWTSGLEWMPENVQRSDMRYFDYVLVNATEPKHASLAQALALQPVTATGRWRLYKTDAPPAR